MHLRHGSPRFFEDEGLHQLSIDTVGDSHYCGCLNIRVLVENPFHLLRVDVKPSDDDDIRHPIKHADIVSFFDTDVISGVEPSLFETLRRHDFVAEVAVGYRCSAYPQDPFASVGNDVPCFGAHLPFIPFNERTNRTQLSFFIGAVYADKGGSLRQSVSLQDSDSKQFLRFRVQLYIQSISSRYHKAERVRCFGSPFC